MYNALSIGFSTAYVQECLAPIASQNEVAAPWQEAGEQNRLAFVGQQLQLSVVWAKKPLETKRHWEALHCLCNHSKLALCMQALHSGRIDKIMADPEQCTWSTKLSSI